MARKSAKESILDAAERVIKREGLVSATIEAVAQEAGVSKGGLFYHFASKKDLLFQLIDRYDMHFRRLRDELLETLPESPGKLLKATIIASLTHPARYNDTASNLLALLTDAEMREKVGKIKQSVVEEVIAGSENPEKIAIAMLAIDGLWMADMFGGKTYNNTFKKRIIGELLRLIDVHEKKSGAEQGGRMSAGCKRRTDDGKARRKQG